MVCVFWGKDFKFQTDRFRFWDLCFCCICCNLQLEIISNLLTIWSVCDNGLPTISLVILQTAHSTMLPSDLFPSNAVVTFCLCVCVCGAHKVITLSFTTQFGWSYILRCEVSHQRAEEKNDICNVVEYKGRIKFVYVQSGSHNEQIKMRWFV